MDNVLGPFFWMGECCSAGNLFADPENQSLTAWILGTLHILVKEFFAVFIQIVCYSRINTGDMFTGALILFMMLVTFSFPFLSSYLYAVLRLGPWFVKDMKGRALMRLLLQIVLVTGAHLAAALAAHEFMKQNKSIWKYSSLIEMQTTPNQNTTETEVGWRYQNSDEHVNGIYPFLQECLNTLFFMVGLLHLMEADSDKLMTSAFFNTEKKTKDTNVATVSQIEKAQTPQTNTTDPVPQAPGMSSTIAYTQKNISPYRLMAENPPVPSNLITKEISDESKFLTDVRTVLDKIQKNSEDTLKEIKPKKPTHIPIPITFILHVCILLAATSRAFPEAHGTPAITLYLNLQYNTAVTPRLFGGTVGAILSLWYYYAVYVWPGREQPYLAQTYIDKVILAEPAFMYSELTLPRAMNSNKFV